MLYTYFHFYLGFLAHVPRERDGIVGDLLHVPDGAQALLVVGCMKRDEDQNEMKVAVDPTEVVKVSKRKRKSDSAEKHTRLTL